MDIRLVVVAVVVLAAACGSGDSATATSTTVTSTSAAPAAADPSMSVVEDSTSSTEAPTNTERDQKVATTTTTTTTTGPGATETTASVPTTSLHYTFPVDKAGGPSYARDHHDYPAADIFARCGTKAYAPMSGRVEDVSRVDEWNAKTDPAPLRGGLSVSIVGDDGVRYYGSHFRSIDAAITSGVRVRSGDVLGQVGDTGNAAGTGCHLHFGISRPCGPGDWEVRRGEIWPWKYLDQWKQGRPASPKPDLPSKACGAA